MKNLTLRRALLALFTFASLALSSCEPVTTEPVDDGDYRNVFLGDFSFTWNYESVANGDTNVESSTYDGVITRVGTNLLNFEYRPGISRRMVVDQAGNLSEPNALGEGFNSSGTITPTTVSITINWSSSTGSSVSNIDGARL
jgi:hypothetical protein